jgi:myo-inositol-1(or 4)-monophosphatase
MTNSVHLEWLDFAKTLAVKAGEMMVEARSDAVFDRNYKEDHELVTTTDLAIDQYLCAHIMQRYPDHLILSEESFPDIDLQLVSIDTPVWVIDPIDGTVNFAHGHAHVAVSIGLYLDGERIVGVVNAPFLNECYWSCKSHGAYCNNERLTVSDNSVLRNALVATGFPYNKDALGPIIERVSRVLHACQDVRRNGSAALDLCWVATGRLDAYFETVKPWDMAAGALIAEEAGAKVGRYSTGQSHWPEAINGEFLLVSSPVLFDELFTLLQLDH